EQKELVDEVVALAKRYGIATPYTSYLVVPDGPMPIVRPPISGPRPPHFPMPLPGGPIGAGNGGGVGVPPGLGPAGSSQPISTEFFARTQAKGDGTALASNRGLMYERQIDEAATKIKDEKDPAKRALLLKELDSYRDQKKVNDDAERAFKGGRGGYQTGKL